MQIALSTLPQYIYTYADGATYVNLYLPSEYKSDLGTISMRANFPYTNEVEISVSPKSEGEHTLKLRIPSWVSEDVAVTVGNDAPIVGKAGTYLSLTRTWREGDVIRFTLPVRLGAVLYTGLDQAPLSYPRYTFTYGPVLMALRAPECKDESVIPRIPMSIDSVLKLSPDEHLHYAIPGTDYTIMPYWDTPTEGFTCVPIVAEDV